jgi:hypothetical protein
MSEQSLEVRVAVLEERLTSILFSFDEQKKLMQRQQETLDHLVALANQGKGSIWMFITLGGVVGALISNITSLKKLFGA